MEILVKATHIKPTELVSRIHGQGLADLNLEKSLKCDNGRSMKLNLRKIDISFISHVEL